MVSGGVKMNYKNKNYAETIHTVHQALEKDRYKLSPVNLCLSEATTIELPPINWNLYHTVPLSMTARNTGFTVIIKASFYEEIPYINSGPLMEDYTFSQIHFHWSFHNNTGSGHAVSGARYPLEMHVVHLKRNCTNLKEALEVENGVVVIVHLFTLREEPNNRLDQITAVLQFIQNYNSCSRLYPTPLLDLVYPITNDYFLYCGAISSPKGLCQVIWLVSCSVLPVSIHQLDGFRQLRDPKGKFLLSNTNEPHPLDGRSLFLVSPSERNLEEMCGTSKCHVWRNDYIKSSDNKNAEYMSLVDLEDVNKDNCQQSALARRRHAANKRFNDSLIDENINSDARVTVETDMKYNRNKNCTHLLNNVNIIECKHISKPRYDPAETVYSIVSAKGSKLHLRRKQPLLKQNEPSTGAPLNYKLSPHTSPSAPSLSNTKIQLTTNTNGLPTNKYVSKLLLIYQSKVHISSSEPSLSDLRKVINARTSPVYVQDPATTEYRSKLVDYDSQLNSELCTKKLLQEHEGKENIVDSGNNSGVNEMIDCKVKLIVHSSLSEPKIAEVKTFLKQNGTKISSVVDDQSKTNNKNNRPLPKLRSELKSKMNVDFVNNTNEKSIKELRPAKDEALWVDNLVQAKKINLQVKEKCIYITKNNVMTKETDRLNSKEHINTSDISMIDKIFIGKLGKKESFEIFVKRNHVELVDRPKKDLENHIVINFMYNKRLKPNKHVEEPMKQFETMIIVKQLNPIRTNQPDVEPMDDMKMKINDQYNLHSQIKTDNQTGSIYSKSSNRELYNLGTSNFKVSQQRRTEMNVPTKIPHDLSLNRPSANTDTKSQINNASLEASTKKLEQFYANKDYSKYDTLTNETTTGGLNGKTDKIVETKEKMPNEQIYTVSDEENTVQTTINIKERKIIQVAKEDDLYSFPGKRNLDYKNSEHHISKVKIPEPYFIIKLPNKPLVEYETYSVNPNYPTEKITETTVKVNRTVLTRNKTFIIPTTVERNLNLSLCSSQSKISKVVKNQQSSEEIGKTRTFKVKINSSNGKNKDEHNQDTGTLTDENKLEQFCLVDKSVGTSEHLIYKTTREIKSINQVNTTKTDIHAAKEPEYDVNYKASISDLTRNNLLLEKKTTTETSKLRETKNITEKKMSSIINKDEIEGEKLLLNEKNINELQPMNVDNSLKSISLNLTRRLLPILKTDGDIIIHIHQGTVKENKMSTTHTDKQPEARLLNTSAMNIPKIQTLDTKPCPKLNLILDKSKNTGFCYEKSNESLDEDETTDDEQLIHSVDYSLLPQTSKPFMHVLKNSERHSKEGLSSLPLNSIRDEIKSNVIIKVDAQTSQGKPPDDKSNTLNRSPVTIDMKSAEWRNYPTLNFINHWNTEGDALLENNGKTLRGTFLEKNDLPYLNGGPLLADYLFYELHFHWGPKDCCGAEHVIDGQRYPIEGHFMYINRAYDNLQDAMGFVDGIAIVAVLLNVGGPPNPLLSHFIEDIPLIQDCNTGIHIPAWSMFAWTRATVTDSKGYFTYKGTLTSQLPQVECVTWIVFPEPIVVCCQQSREFRKLKSNKGAALRKNFRHPQPLNNRTVYFIPSE